MDPSIPRSKRHAVTKTTLPPCCLQIHPHDTSQIYIGTYKLEDNGTRHGSLDLYTYNTNNNTLILSKSVPVSGAILDIKFHPDATILITVHSTGNITIWDPINLTIINDVSINPDALITSCFFNPHNPNNVLLTFTDGSSCMFDIPTLTPLFFFEAMHELECWTGSFGSSSGSLSNIVYTGGDDACLIAHDIRTNRDVWTLKRGHDAGIVSVLSPGSNGWNMNGGYSLWTGSYDDHLRVWDLRVVDRLNPELIDGYVPKLLNKEDLGGGVWRLIPSPVENDDRVLSCCMYEGVRVIDVQGEERFKVSRFFKEDHESMCYGGDWSSDGKYIATCSFYDNVVQIWSPDECV